MEPSGKLGAKNIHLYIVSFFGTGLLSRKMPGTIGSIFATLVLEFIFHFSTNFLNVFLILSIVTFVIGIISCDTFIVKKKYEHIKDPGYIVIDEACGIFFGAYILGFFTELSAFSIIINLCLFRVFDIWKPFPIGRLEKSCTKNDKTVAFGIMFDDILAAVFASGLQIVISKCF